jgi:trehalose-6-phosphatase
VLVSLNLGIIEKAQAFISHYRELAPQEKPQKAAQRTYKTLNGQKNPGKRVFDT